MINGFKKRNRRSNKREKVFIPAQYLIKNKGMGYEDCTIIDLSQSGAAVGLILHDLLPKHALLDLEIVLPKTLDQVTLSGQLKRVYVKDTTVVGCIKFEQMLPVPIFQKLLARHSYSAQTELIKQKAHEYYWPST